jgi:hypothetical protein
MDRKKIDNYQVALIKELNESILKKVSDIREKIILATGSARSDYLQILTMVDDDLDDVLLNWETRAYTSKLFMNEEDMIDEDDD